MSKATLLFPLVLLLVFGLGITVGFFLGGSSAVPDASEKQTSRSSSKDSPDVAAQERIQGNTLLSDRIRELKKELAEQKASERKAVADRLAFFEKYHRQIGVQPFDHNMNVTPEMAELLGLSNEQKRAVEQHLAEIKGEVERWKMPIRL